MKHVFSRKDEHSMNQKIREERENKLIIEDDIGVKTSFYPQLVINDFEIFSIHNQNRNSKVSPFRKDQRSSHMFPAENRQWIPGEHSSTQVESRPLNKITSAKNLLRDISSRYEAVFKQDASRTVDGLVEKLAVFNSDLLYMIAATDGNEDNIGHSLLVARYALVLAKAYGIDDKNLLIDIERGALLHDIGKIGISESILRKAGPLTHLEREVVKTHPLLGHEMIEEFEFLRKAARVVLFHHESYDGRGYPYGLASEDIPLEARLFAVTDTLDAITSDRPYRMGQSFQVAFQEIEKGRGTQFDPGVVDAFFSVPESKWIQVKIETEASLRKYTIH